MNERSPRTVLVALNVPPALEERLIDWLLARDADAGFTLYTARGHGAHSGRLSIAEQVRGYQHRSEARMELPEAQLDDVVAELGSVFGGADVFYYVIPVLRSGHLRA
jgi:hypothetical protein